MKESKNVWTRDYAERQKKKTLGMIEKIDVEQILGSMKRKEDIEQGESSRTDIEQEEGSRTDIEQEESSRNDNDTEGIPETDSEI